MRSALIVAAMALVTYLCRVCPLLSLGDPARLPGWVKRRLEYLAPAILAAMVAPAVLVRGGGLTVRPELLAFGICLAVALKTRRLFPPVLLGMAVLLGMHVIRI